MRFGAAFFGWLTVVGRTVLLAALVAGTGSAIGFSSDTTGQDAANGITGMRYHRKIDNADCTLDQPRDLR